MRRPQRADAAGDALVQPRRRISHAGLTVHQIGYDRQAVVRRRIATGGTGDRIRSAMPRLLRSPLWTRPSTIAALYAIITTVMTWPLIGVSTRQVAGDTGDTLFNCWVLLWTSGQVLRALKGDIAALADYFN